MDVDKYIDTLITSAIITARTLLLPAPEHLALKSVFARASLEIIDEERMASNSAARK
jgi:hypothetical protein